MPRQIDKEWFLSVSDVLTNLSAGWFALVIITPNIDGAPGSEIIRATLINTCLGILALWIAVKLRRLSNEDTL